jgi:hypothetical protein
MTDQEAAALSSTLLARKGTAGSEGFAPLAVDPCRPVWRQPRVARLVSAVAIAAALGATAAWFWVGGHGAEPTAAVPSGAQTHVELAAASDRGDGQAREELTAPTAPAPVVATVEAPPAPVPLAAEQPPAARQAAAVELELKPVQPAAAATGLGIDKPKTPTPAAHLASKAAQPARAPAYRVQLHTLRSKEAVEREWTKLRRQYGDLLANKQLVINRLDAAGTEPRYRMQVGGMPSKAAARQLCRALEDRGQKCILVPTT